MRDTARSEPDRARPRERRSTPPEPSHDVLELQRTVGNRAARNLLSRDVAQADTKQETTVEIGDLGRIPLLSYSFGMSNPNTGTSGGGKGEDRSHHDIHLVTETGDLTAKLANAVVTGEHFATVVITTSRLTITLKDVIFSGYSTGGVGGGGTPTDQWSLNYGSIEYKYGGGG